MKGVKEAVDEQGVLAVLTTGTSFHTFVLSKEPDAIWDSALTKYLAGKDIPFEKL